jgi:HEAT repeat protein
MGSGEEHWARVESLERSTSTPELLDVLDNEKECWHTLGAAMRALARLRAPEAGPAILKTLARAEDPDVREAAIHALGELRFARAARVLERIASEDPVEHLRAAARAALERVQAQR